MVKNLAYCHTTEKSRDRTSTVISPIGLQTCLSVAARAPATGCQEILKKLVVLSNISDLASLEQGLQTETRWH